jgi:hypothetical protein
MCRPCVLSPIRELLMLEPLLVLEVPLALEPVPVVAPLLAPAPPLMPPVPLMLPVPVVLVLDPLIPELEPLLMLPALSAAGATDPPAIEVSVVLALFRLLHAATATTAVARIAMRFMKSSGEK